MTERDRVLFWKLYRDGWPNVKRSGAWLLPLVRWKWGLYRRHEPAIFGHVHEELTRLYQDGRIDPLVSRVLPLDEAPAALGALAGRSTVGKVVLRP